MRRPTCLILAAVLVLCLSPPAISVAAGAQTELSFSYTVSAPDYTLELSGSWTQGSQTGLVIRSSGDLDKFIGINIDNVPLGANNYTAVSGSTVITLSPSYLRTLSNGEHSIELIFTDGSVKTWFTILAASTPGGNDQGGDDQGGNNQGGNSQGGNSQGGNSQGGNSQGGNSQGGNSQGGNSQGGNNQGGNSQGGNSQGGSINIEPEDTPLGDLPEELLDTIGDAHTVAPDPARPGYYFELDESGTQLGEWHKDESGSAWIYDEYPPLSALPKTGQNAQTWQLYIALLAVSLPIFLAALKLRRKSGRK